MNSALVADTEAATLPWLMGALGHAHARGHTILVGFLDAIVEDVAFDAEAARGRGYIHGRYI